MNAHAQDRRPLDDAFAELERKGDALAAAKLLGADTEPHRRALRRAALDYARAAKRIFTTTEAD